jgi:hypothetical protein
MDPERRRSRRVAVDGDGANAVLKGALPVAVRDISPGGLRLALGSALEAGGVYPLSLLLRGLSLATPVRITRCRPGGIPGASAGSWEAGAEFLWRDEADAAIVRGWLERKAPVAF